MTEQGWRELVSEFAADIHGGDTKKLELLAAVLFEQDQAKQALRDKGYGCTGLGLLRTVDEVPSR